MLRKTQTSGMLKHTQGECQTGRQGVVNQGAVTQVFVKQGSSKQGLSTRGQQGGRAAYQAYMNAVQKQRSTCLCSALSNTQPPKQCLQDNLQFSVCIRAVTRTSEMRERTKGFFKQAGLPMKTTMKVMISSTCRPSSDLGECCPTYSISSHKSSTKYSCTHSVGPISGLCAEQRFSKDNFSIVTTIT